MAFKDRIQKMDSEGFDENTLINVTSLNLPFTNYCRNKGAEPDDREASVSAAQMVIGDYDPLTFNFLKAMAIKTTFEGTMWFSNWDDAEVAYNLLHWEQNPKGPIWIYTPVNWYGVNLLIPSFITIEELDLHPDYKEAEWLETSKIVPVKYKFTVRSYEVRIDKYDKIVLPLRFGDKYDEKENVAQHILHLLIGLNIDNIQSNVSIGSNCLTSLRIKHKTVCPNCKLLRCFRNSDALFEAVSNLLF